MLGFPEARRASQYRDERGGRSAPVSQHLRHGGQQHVGLERLAERGMGAQQPRHFQVLASERSGDGDDSEARHLVAQTVDGFDALLSGHDQIGDQQIHASRLHGRDRLGAVCGLNHVVPA